MHDFLVSLIFSLGQFFSWCGSVISHYIIMYGTKGCWGKRQNYWNFGIIVRGFGGFWLWLFCCLLFWVCLGLLLSQAFICM